MNPPTWSLLSLLVLTSLVGTSAIAENRTWKNSSGRVVEAEYTGMKGDSVLLKLTSGQTVAYPLTQLSTEDQDFIKTLSGGGAPAPAAPASTSRLPLEQRTWPAAVEVPAKSVEIAAIQENPGARKFVYQSEAFEFTSQAKLAPSMMKEVARTFEATKSLIEALPWGIQCRPPEGRPRFLAALYETRDDYQAAGGPELSGGVYSSGDKIFKIPFPSLGLKRLGKTYTRDDNYSNGTLVHEITHQLMDDYLAFLPKWVIEGTAEYTEMLPYKAGIFRAAAHKNGMKEDADAWVKNEGFVLQITDLQRMMTMTRDQWDAECSTAQKMRDMYHRSQLLVYFFCHLDDGGKGTRFIQFMEAAYAQVADLRKFFDDPRVKRMEGGRFSYPTTLTPPDMKPDSAPFKHLGLLIAERPWPKLAQEIMDGYKGIGVKVMVR